MLVEGCGKQRPLSMVDGVCTKEDSHPEQSVAYLDPALSLLNAQQERHPSRSIPTSLRMHGEIMLPAIVLCFVQGVSLALTNQHIFPFIAACEPVPSLSLSGDRNLL